MEANADVPDTAKTSEAPILVIEPFYGGSHRQLIDLLLRDLPVLSTQGNTDLFTLAAKKWKWRLRTSALYFANSIPRRHHYKVMFCTSMLNLSELLALRSDLVPLRKIIYFHENQIAYPSREEQPKERDAQFPYIQFLSCLVSDVIAWNSSFNLTSFLQGIPSQLFNLMPPDQRSGLSDLPTIISSKSLILPFPIPSFDPPMPSSRSQKQGPLHIVWNHRFEWDKGPEIFFQVLFSLLTPDATSSQLDVRISVIGEQFGETPPIFAAARDRLGTERILHWGFIPERKDYFSILESADVVVSTTLHEFFGVSILEAIQRGCYPLCPNRLVFPEYLPQEFLYNTEKQLEKRLRYYAKYPEKLRSSFKNGTPEWRKRIDLSKFEWNEALKQKYSELFGSKS